MLSHWIPGLQFVPRPLFFVGMALVTIPLLALSLVTWRDSKPLSSVLDARIQEDDASLSAPILGVGHSRAVVRLTHRRRA
jgi:hypothetical protein